MCYFRNDWQNGTRNIEKEINLKWPTSSLFAYLKKNLVQEETVRRPRRPDISILIGRKRNMTEKPPALIQFAISACLAMMIANSIYATKQVVATGCMSFKKKVTTERENIHVIRFIASINLLVPASRENPLHHNQWWWQW